MKLKGLVRIKIF